MKICMILGHDFMHPYLDHRVYKEAKSLLKFGHNVTVVCWPRRIEDLPEWEDYEGIKIRRITHKLASKESSILIRGMQFQKLRRKMINAIVDLKPEVIHCHDLETLPIGVKVKKKLRIPLIYDSHEDWPALESAQSRIWGFVTKILELRYLRYVDRVVTVNSTLAKKFEKLRKKTWIITNYPSLSFGKNSARNDIENIIQRYELKNKIVITYHGGISKNKGIGEMIEAASHLTKKYENLKFLAIGRGHKIDKYKTLVKEKGLENVFTFTGTVPHETIPSFLKASDIGYCIQRATKQYVPGMPVKALEDMCMGLPIICNKEFPEVKRIIGENNAGILVNCTINEIVEGLQQLIEDKDSRQQLGKNGRKAVEREYNWEKQEEKLLRVYDEFM